MERMPSRSTWILAGVLLVGGCGDFFADGSSAGTCELGGVSVNTYQIFGKWKLLSYSPPRNPTELEGNYDLLIVEPGDKMCMVRVSNGVATETVFRADYTHNVRDRRAVLSYTEGEFTGEDPLQYSFSGSCGDTRMRVLYNNGVTEQYGLFSVEAAVGECNPQ
jgi:hypothetical protein